MLSNHSSRLYCDEEDVEGLLRVLEQETSETDSQRWRDYCNGAWSAVHTLLYHQLRDQSEFMGVFNTFAPEGIKPNYEGNEK